MNIILPTLAVAFAAFCVWLTVRIINWRERWARQTLAGVVSLPVLYVLSMGPAFYLADWLGTSSFMVIYEPLESVGREFDPFWGALMWYLELWGIHISC